MEDMIKKYEDKLVHHGLCDAGAPLLSAIDDELIWNRENETTSFLTGIYDRLNINSLLFSKPAEPYWTIIEYLTGVHKDTIKPEDCETRTFLHDLPIVNTMDVEKISAALKVRKCAIIPGSGIITYGTVTPEQAFVFFSSVCFSTFVKFFSDYLLHYKEGSISTEEQQIFDRVLPQIPVLPETCPDLMEGPFTDEESVYKAIAEAGKKTVDYKLVDSYFGNISYKMGDTLFISQTTSSLDELAGCVDPCPLDNSTCAGLTASSELSAHKEVVLKNPIQAILHGHPRFSVILSMDCDKSECEDREVCFKKCPEKRSINDIPIVPGEVGTGRFGLCNTMPPAMPGKRGVIVYGHGVFTTGKEDFNEAFQKLMDIEKMCMQEYLKRVGR